MSKKRGGLKGGFVPRNLAVSLAGIRAGSALAVDSAVQRMTGGGDDYKGSALARHEARRFVRELGRLKGTYIKIGQMLALFGEHYLPAVLVDALRDLSDQTEPLHWDALESAVRDSLGARFDELEFDTEAFAAASLAQVHLARIRDTGEWICLKLQYPGLRQVIDADFDAVVRMLRLARWVSTGRDVDDWLRAMRGHLHNEIDYAREARLTERMAELAEGISDRDVPYRVPRLFRRYCTDTVLAMEFMEGYSVADPDVSRLSLERRNALASAMLELFFLELYEWGVLQTDPNFGNYLLRLDDRRRRSGDDELVLLDFGSVLEPSPDFLYNLRRAIDAGMREDIPALTESLVGLGCLRPDASEEGRRLFADFCLQLLEPLRPPDRLPSQYLSDEGRYCWGTSGLMRRVGKKAALSAASRHFTTPSRDFALIARKLSGLYNFIAVLDAQFNAHAMAQAHIDRWRDREADGATR
ncbi:MAG: AarF/ABC1/UbiB kinase family protein [Halioglobus sp.]|nr:AarF/ABC1/UbiB kinase family protein [Halioglobus sp.]